FKQIAHINITTQFSITTTTLSIKPWNHVTIIVIYGAIGLTLAFLLYAWCNHSRLEDKTLKNLGFRINRARFMISIVAVLLASVATAIAGMFTFFGLLIPHLGRSFVGADGKMMFSVSVSLG